MNLKEKLEIVNREIERLKSIESKEEKFELLKDIKIITHYGEGYYTGNSKSESFFTTNSVYEIVKKEVLNYKPYFYELDGKHSEVEGEVETLSFDVNDQKSSMMNFSIISKEDPIYELWENLEEGDELFDKMSELSDRIVNFISENIEVKEVVVHNIKFLGEEVE